MYTKKLKKDLYTINYLFEAGHNVELVIQFLDQEYYFNVSVWTEYVDSLKLINKTTLVIQLE